MVSGTDLVNQGGQILHEFGRFSLQNTFSVSFVDVAIQNLSSMMTLDPLQKGAKISDENVRGFIVKTTTKALESLSSLSLEYKPTIEDDGTVHTVDT